MHVSTCSFRFSSPRLAKVLSSLIAHCLNREPESHPIVALCWLLIRTAAAQWYSYRIATGQREVREIQGQGKSGNFEKT